MQRYITRFAIATLLAVAGTGASADDIDIYAAPTNSPGGTPLVMFTLDWRPNLTSPVCQGSECDFLVPEYLDSTPTTYFNLLRAVLKRVLSNLSGIHVGLMLNHNQGERTSCAGPQTGNNQCTNGGYVLKGFTAVDDSPGMADFFHRLESIPDPQGNSAHPYQGSELFFELFRYLTGQAIFNGHNGWTDFGTDGQRNIDDPLDTAPQTAANLQWDTAIENGADYISPLVGTGGCGTGIYTVNIMFQVSQQEADSDNAITASKGDGGMAGINLKGGLGPSGTFGRVLKYLNDVDLADGSFGAAEDFPGKQNVTSYFIVDPTKINQTTNGYAQSGGTGSALPLSEDPRELIETLEDIFNQILSVSTTFVSPSLPLNVFNRIDLVDDVYLAIFRADPEIRPFWNGNLKKLKLATDGGGDPVLLDANNISAVNPLDGRIKSTALTLWSRGEDIPAPPEGETDWTLGHDGRATNQGGAGGVIPGFRPVAGYTPGLENPVAGPTTEAGPRRLFTEPSAFANGTASTFMDLNADEYVAQTLLEEDDKLFKTVLPDTDCGDPVSCANYTAADSGYQDEAEARMLGLLAFARGLTDTDGNRVYDVKRPWFMADPLHSRPQPINYGGDPDNPDIRVLMATNDGYLHMFRGDTGIEDWAFMPRVVMPVLERLRDNNPGELPIHPYTVDGSTTTLLIDANRDGSVVAADGDRAIAYIGLRRGGKYFYALDVTTPDEPKLLWRIGPDRTGFEQMAQSWSSLNPVYIPNPAGGANTGRWALIFGGGYNGDDTGKKIDLGKDERNDTDPTFTGSQDFEGNGIYVVDALTGDLIWRATGPSFVGETRTSTDTHFFHPDMVDSIAAEVSVTNAIPDAFADRGYVGDTGGTIWRVDFASADTAQWRVTRLFSAGRHHQPDSTLDDRRFYHGLDIVRAEDGAGEFDAIVGATGTRPHPLAALTEDHLYVIKDRALRTDNPAAYPGFDTALDHGDVLDLTDNCLQSQGLVDCYGEDAEAGLRNGWRMKLEQCEGSGSTGLCGEKGLSKPTTFLGKILFTSFIPPGQGPNVDECAPSEGTGLRYAVSLQNATAVRNFDVSNDTAESVTLERFDKLASGGIPSEIIRIGAKDGRTVFINPDLSFDFDADLSFLRTYWYENVTR